MASQTPIQIERAVRLHCQEQFLSPRFSGFSLLLLLSVFLFPFVWFATLTTTTTTTQATRATRATTGATLSMMNEIRHNTQTTFYKTTHFVSDILFFCSKHSSATRIAECSRQEKCSGPILILVLDPGCIFLVQYELRYRMYFFSMNGTI